MQQQQEVNGIAKEGEHKNIPPSSVGSSLNSSPANQLVSFWI